MFHELFFRFRRIRKHLLRVKQLGGNNSHAHRLYIELNSAEQNTSHYCSSIKMDPVMLDECQLNWEMSAITKSASFRSRIPVRRTKPLPRRCYSPPPLSTTVRTIKTTASASAIDQHRYMQEQQQQQQEQSSRHSVNARNRGRLQRHQSKSKHHHHYQQQQHHQHQQQQQPMWTSHGPSAKLNKCATYSSSSFSSGDESQESDEPVPEKVNPLTWFYIYTSFLYFLSTSIS